MSALTGGSIVVEAGRDGWLYLAAFADSRFLDVACDPSAWAQERLPKHVANFEARGRRVTDRGLPFVVLIAPEAASIYPEFLPPGRQVHFPTIGERVSADLKARAVEVVNPSEDLRKSKGRIDLYCRLDSHWSFAGAYIAYRALMDRVRLHLPVNTVPCGAVFYGVQDSYGDLGVHARPERKGPMQTVQVEGYSVEADAAVFDIREANLRRFRCAQGFGRALIFRDSFANGLSPFLERTFAETILVAPAPMLMDAAIDHFQPDIVIYEVAERALCNLEDPLTDFSGRSFAQDYLEIASNPETGRAQVEVAKAVREGRAEQVLDKAIAIADLGGANPRPYNLAWAYHTLGRYDEVLKLAEAHADATQDQFLYFLQAHALSLLGRVPEASTAIDRALSIQPRNGHFLCIKGNLLYQLGLYADAVPVLERAVRYVPTYVGVRVLLEAAYRAVGRDADAAAERESIGVLGGAPA